jgi:hypothetical protein
VFQWLTSNQHFIDVDSPLGPPKTAMLLGRKSEFRIAVNIPYYGRNRLRRWVEYAKANKIPLRQEIAKDLGNETEWWVYAGIIPPKWFRGIARNPTSPDWLPPPPKPLEIPMNRTGDARGARFEGPAQSLV